MKAIEQLNGELSVAKTANKAEVKSLKQKVALLDGNLASQDAAYKAEILFKDNNHQGELDTLKDQLYQSEVKRKSQDADKNGDAKFWKDKFMALEAEKESKQVMGYSLFTLGKIVRKCRK